jgi:hypothetical protein
MPREATRLVLLFAPEGWRPGQRRPEPGPTGVKAKTTAAIKGDVCADEHQRVRRVKAARFNRRVCAVPSCGVGKYERLRPQG